MSGPVTFGAELLRIAPADIHIPERLGLFFPDKAAALGRLMAIHGQRTPITVRKSAGKVAEPWTLVVGMHRLNGALIEELPQVFALERIGGTAADALDEEASENLDRRDQPPLERAIFIHATCAAAMTRVLGDGTQQKLAAKARWDKVRSGEIRAEQALQDESNDAADTMSGAYGWMDSVAEAFGRDPRSIRRALTLYRMLIEPFPEFTQALSDHPVVGNNAAQLKAIADLPGENQRRAVIELLLASPSLSSDEARVAVGIAQQAKGPTHPFDKFAGQITTGWQRMSLPQRRDFVPRIVEMMHTPELKRELRDRLNAELGE